MSAAGNIAFDLRARAVAMPEAPAVIAPDVTLPFAKLWRIVDCVACRMDEAGIGQGSRVALHTHDRIVSVAVMFAAALVGAEFVSLDPQLMRVAELQPTHFIRSPEAAGMAGHSFIVMDETWSPRSGSGSADNGASWPGYASADAPAWIVQSSGTTGLPKFMRLSQALVHRRVRAVMSEFDPGRTRLATLFHPGARPFLIRAAAALLSGCALIDSRDVVFFRAQGVDLLCASPRQVREWLPQGTLTPRLPRLQCSGARLDPDETRRLLDSFDVVEDVYGSSETIKAHVNVSRLVDGRMVTRGQDAGSEIEILRDDLTPCAEGETGTVRIRNSCMAEGYVGNPEATARSFRDGWFHPGDLAAWGPDGRLDVAGRANDVLNLGGQKVSLTEVDRLLAAVPGVAHAVSFRHPAEGRQDELAAMVQLEDVSQSDQIVARAHAACAQALGPVASPREIMVVPGLPLTADGVPRRAECHQMFRKAAGLAPDSA